MLDVLSFSQDDSSVSSRSSPRRAPLARPAGGPQWRSPGGPRQKTMTRRERINTAGSSSSAPSAVLPSSTGWDIRQAGINLDFTACGDVNYISSCKLSPALYVPGLLLNPLSTELGSGKAEISFTGSLQVLIEHRQPTGTYRIQAASKYF